MNTHFSDNDQKGYHPSPLETFSPQSFASPTTNYDSPLIPGAPLMPKGDFEKTSSRPWIPKIDSDLENTRDVKVLSQRNAGLKSSIRVLKFSTRFLAFIFSAYTLATMALMLAIFFRTAPIKRTLYLPPEPITRGPWHADSKTWPTYLLLATSIISCSATFVVIAMYLHSVKYANKASARASNLAYLLFGMHVVVWIGTASAYVKGKDGLDLWGWSCKSDVQDRLQLFFEDEVDFKLLCAIQTSSWAVSLIQIVLTLINVYTYWYTYRRLRVQRCLSGLSPDEASDQQKPPRLELKLPFSTELDYGQQHDSRREDQREITHNGRDEEQESLSGKLKRGKKHAPEMTKMGLGYVTNIVGMAT